MADNWFKAEVAFTCPHCGRRSTEILFANASRHDPNAVARRIQQTVAPLTCRLCKKVTPAGIRVDIGMNDLKPEDVAKENLPIPSLPPFDPVKPCPCGLHGKNYGDCCKDHGIHALGKDWFDEQSQRPAGKRHAVARWREAMVELLKRPPRIDDGFHVAHTLTGPVKAFQCFGYDLYWLQLFHKLPASLIERLKDFHGFQGARYEVLIAAVFARAGFDIEWIDDDKAGGKHPEFIATHRASGRRVGVEAKSRKRSGSVNYPGGEVKPETHLKGDVFDLYEKAIQQSPEGGIPFLIFIDANVPDSSPKGLPSYDHIPIETAPWIVEIRDRLVSIWKEATEPSPESGVMVTNFAFYYGDNESPSPTGMGAFFPSLKPRVPILGNPMLADLEYCLRSYDKVPRQI